MYLEFEYFIIFSYIIKKRKWFSKHMEIKGNRSIPLFNSHKSIMLAHLKVYDYRSAATMRNNFKLLYSLYKKNTE